MPPSSVRPQARASAWQSKDRHSRCPGRIVAHVATMYAVVARVGAAPETARKGHFMHLFPYVMQRLLLGAVAGLVLATAARAADPVFPVNSRLGLVAPAGFTPSTKFAGFEN